MASKKRTEVSSSNSRLGARLRLNPRKRLFCNAAQCLAYIWRSREEEPMTNTGYPLLPVHKLLQGYAWVYNVAWCCDIFLVVLLDICFNVDLTVQLVFVHNSYKTHRALNPECHPNNSWMCSHSQHRQNCVRRLVEQKQHSTFECTFVHK